MVLASASFWTTLLGRGVSPWRPLEEFLVLGVHALFARGNLVHYSSSTLYLAVYSTVFGILQEMTLSGGAMV